MDSTGLTATTVMYAVVALLLVGLGGKMGYGVGHAIGYHYGYSDGSDDQSVKDAKKYHMRFTIAGKTVQVYQPNADTQGDNNGDDE